jgi:hypothetical protein
MNPWCTFDALKKQLVMPPFELVEYSAAITNRSLCGLLWFTFFQQHSSP